MFEEDDIAWSKSALSLFQSFHYPTASIIINNHLTAKKELLSVHNFTSNVAKQALANVEKVILSDVDKIAD
jgi:hypothetical protein